jgi:hypothetical protein
LGVLFFSSFPTFGRGRKEIKLSNQTLTNEKTRQKAAMKKDEHTRDETIHDETTRAQWRGVRVNSAPLTII